MAKANVGESLHTGVEVSEAIEGPELELQLTETDRALKNLQQAAEMARQDLLAFTEGIIKKPPTEGEQLVRQMYERAAATRKERQEALRARREASTEIFLEPSLSEMLDGLKSVDPRMQELAVSVRLAEEVKSDLLKLGEKYKREAKDQAEKDAGRIEAWESQIKSGGIEAMEERAREKIHAGSGLPKEETIPAEVRDWAKALLENPIAFKGFVVGCEARMAAVMKREYLYDFDKGLDEKRLKRRGVIESKMPGIFGGLETDLESREKVREHLRLLAEIGEKRDFRFGFERVKELHGLEIDMEGIKDTIDMIGQVAGVLNFVVEQRVGDRKKEDQQASLAQLREDRALLYALVAEAYIEKDLANSKYLYAEAEAGEGVDPEEPRFRYRKGRMPTWKAELANPSDAYKVIEEVPRSAKEIAEERARQRARYKGSGWRR